MTSLATAASKLPIMDVGAAPFLPGAPMQPPRLGPPPAPQPPSQPPPQQQQQQQQQEEEEEPAPPSQPPPPLATSSNGGRGGGRGGRGGRGLSPPLALLGAAAAERALPIQQYVTHSTSQGAVASLRRAQMSLQIR